MRSNLIFFLISFLILEIQSQALWLVNPWYPYNFFRKRDIGNENANMRVECLFLRNKNILSCNQDLVECDAIPQMNNINEKFDLFGVEFLNEINAFNLYPKNLTSTFSDSTIMFDNGVMVKFGIYVRNDKNELRGLMIRDKECFNRLTRLFDAIKTPTLIDVTSLDKKKTKVAISGFIL